MYQAVWQFKTRGRGRDNVYREVNMSSDNHPDPYGQQTYKKEEGLQEWFCDEA